ncbi:MAG: glycosyltransferase family 4 protein [Pseudomonadota bacterium]
MAWSKPHIVLVGGDGGPSGVPRHITNLVRAIKDDAQVTVLSEANHGGYNEVTSLGAQHVALPGLASRLNPNNIIRGQSALANWLSDAQADLVWGHARMPVIYLRRLLQSGRWTPTPATKVALSYHGLPFGKGARFGMGAFSLYIERQLLKGSMPLDLVFLTEDQQACMLAEIGSDIAQERCHILGNASHLGVLPEDTPRDVSGRHLVMTGRTGWQKNYEAALRLLRHLPDDVTLSLCGPGTDRPAFTERARRLAGPAASRLRLLGPLSDVRHLLAAADGYLLTSRYEGQPIGAIEAMEAGLPLILSTFEGAHGLTQDHPLALLLDGSESDQAAAIDQMLSRYLANRSEAQRQIREFWATRYTPDRFDTAARALVFEKILA